MKTTISLIIGILISFGSFAGDTISVKSKIKEVTVFLKGAQITRTAQIRSPSGNKLIVLKGLSTDIQEQSIQVSANSNFTILSVSFRVNYLSKHKDPKKTRLLYKKRQLLQKNIKELDADYEVYSMEEKVITNNSFSKGRQKEITAEALQKASDLYKQRLMYIKMMQFYISQKQDSLKRKINIIDGSLYELNYKKENPTGEILIRIKSKSSANTKLTVSYAVSSAAWFPKYNVQVKSTEKPLNLTLNANIFQSTGVDWKNVKLTISNANLKKNGVRPILKTWFLDFARNQCYYNNQNYDNKSTTETRTIFGVVIDENGEALPGATVSVKGSTIATMTSLTGSYSINVPEKYNTLVYTAMMKNSTELDIRGQSIANVVLADDDVNIEEVVVTALGVSKTEKSLAYAASTVNFDDDEYIQTKNRTALNGKVAGVNVKKSYGNPGTSTKVIMRGLSSLQGENQPLYIIDGVPINTQNGSSINSGTDFGNSINDIDPKDITNTTFLKGKDAIALYGSRAKNGVIVITTKKGSMQKNTVMKKETSVEYILEKPYTILSDNKKHAVDVKTYNIIPEYKYASVPLMDNSVFLTAQIKDRSNYDLLSANSDLFFEGTYIGEAYINALVSDSVLNFSLGRDNDVYIKREKLVDFTDKQFIGNKKVETFAYEITVRNKKASSINIKLEDRIPISSTNKIKVSILEISKAKHNKNTGILSWDLKLKPKETKKIIIKYSVKYPKVKFVNLDR